MFLRHPSTIYVRSEDRAHDLLTGAGTVRDETEVDCPGCGEETQVPTQEVVAVCTSCDTKLELERPF